jgi:sulfate transport system ATP-binding protein
MAIRLEQLTKRYQGRPVVSNLTLAVAGGELRVLLGPSGSGKSTVLRLIAGLTPADSGKVLLDGRDLAGVPAQRRDLGFVFQSYALFGRMTVAENVEFALAVRRVPRRERRQRREELLERVGLAGLGGRMPHQLSGGQQQRVALARALAHRPRLLLLDEPFGALDARIRVELRRGLAEVQRELAVTTLFVTHDQEEAFELADRIAVLAHGRLVEEGPPAELYQRPQTEFVAVFLGGANLWVGESTSAGVRLGDLEMPLSGAVGGEHGGAGAGASRRVQVLVRPEDVEVSIRREDLGHPALGEGEVAEVAFAGPVERLRLRLPAPRGLRVIHPPPPFGDEHLAVEVERSRDQARRQPLQPGDRVFAGVRRLHALLHPGLAFAAVGPGVEEYAAELARLAQARLGRLAAVADLRERLAVEPADLVIAGLPAADPVERVEELLGVAADSHLLLVRGAPSLPPQRFLVAVAVGEPGKDDVAFVGRLARHLGSPATVLTVLPPAAGEDEEAAARRFLAGCVRTLDRFGVRAVPEAVRGDVGAAIAERMRGGSAGYDFLTVGAPLLDDAGRYRLRRASRALVEWAGDHPILIVRGGRSFRTADGRV